MLTVGGANESISKSWPGDQIEVYAPGTTFRDSASRYLSVRGEITDCAYCHECVVGQVALGGEVCGMNTGKQRYPLFAFSLKALSCGVAWQQPLANFTVYYHHASQ